MTERDLRILYVTDPMCSWCWGFVPVLEHLERISGLPVQYVLGGLAPDSDEPMPEATRRYVQQAWLDVGARTGAEFNFEFWERCAPRRSTWPACRAVVLARAKGLEREMFRAIQEAYYLEARNPSDDELLAELAEGLGMDREAFLIGLKDEATQRALQADFEVCRALGASSFPSLAVSAGDEQDLLHSGWCDAAGVEALWERWSRASR